MILVLIIIFVIMAIIMGALYDTYDSEVSGGLGLLFVILALGFTIFGCFNGFINKPRTEGIHQGIITAVDLEGIWFRRYEIYIKSGGYSKDNNSDETKYCVYEYEKELKTQLQNAIGKEVKINYGHDGGYIGWKSCGTYHIKSIEIIEKGEKNE